MSVTLDETAEPLRTVDPERSRVRVDSRHLLAGHRELVIVHNGREYCLRLTQNDKLILTA
jgi:hemin uptake protein HemP